MSKYVTQGEREMVEAVVGAGMVCECQGEELIGESYFSGVHIGRPAEAGSGLAVFRATGEHNDQPLLVRSLADGEMGERGIDFDRDHVLEMGHRVATRDWVDQGLAHYATRQWVEEQLPPPPPGISSDWLVSSDTVIGTVLFENVGEREFEYQPRDGVQVTFYPRTSSQNLPMPWSMIQQRIVGYGTTGPKIQVRCIADDGTKTPFVAVVINEAA